MYGWKTEIWMVVRHPLRDFHPNDRIRSAEQVFERNDALHVAGILVALQPERRYHDHAHTFSRPRLTPERLHAFREFPVFRRIDLVFATRELHLADIYHVVPPVKKHVDLDWLLAWLAAFRAPGVHIGQNARYPQRGADLRDVPQAETFERQPPPGVHGAARIGKRPEPVVGALSVSKELEIELYHKK